MYPLNRYLFPKFIAEGKLVHYSIVSRPFQLSINIKQILDKYVIFDFDTYELFPHTAIGQRPIGYIWTSPYIFVFLDLKEQIEWPALIICKLPRYKNEQKYQEFVKKGFFEKFASQEEFDNLENEAFDKDIKSTIHAVTIGE